MRYIFPYGDTILRYIFLFPGQGAQYVGMGKDLYEADERIRTLFKDASDISGFDVTAMLFEGSAEDLAVTDVTQIVTTVTNIAAAYYLQSQRISPIRVAGFSLGEYAAMVVAGVLSVSDALRAVKLRGDIMEEVSRNHDSASGRSGLVAVLGLSREEVRTILEERAVSDAYIAIHNSPSQVVVAGTAQGLVDACTALSERDAQIVPLKVSGPFHTSLMKEASERYVRAIKEIEFRDPYIPLYSNVTGSIVDSGKEMKRLCGIQIMQVVEWVREQEHIARDSAGDGEMIFLTVGPGRVLSGLWHSFRKRFPAEERETLPRIMCAGTREQIDTIVEKML